LINAYFKWWKKVSSTYSKINSVRGEIWESLNTQYEQDFDYMYEHPETATKNDMKLMKAALEREIRHLSDDINYFLDQKKM